MRHQNCSGPGCRVRGRWPRKSGPRRIVKPTEDMIRPPLPIPHRIIDLLPAAQVVSLWEFRQGLLGGENNALGIPPQAQAATGSANA